MDDPSHGMKTVHFDCSGGELNHYGHMGVTHSLYVDEFHEIIQLYSSLCWEKLGNAACIIYQSLI